MSNKSSGSRNSLTSGNLQKHTIPIRIEFIKELLHGKVIKPMVDFNNVETENFMGMNMDNSDSPDDKDIRHRLEQKKKKYNFINIISEIGGRLLYIKSGATGHTFKGSIKDDVTGEEINYAVKVVAYPKKDRYGSIIDADRPENAELLMIKLLSYFVVNGKTPHIVLPITYFNTSITNFVNLLDTGCVDEEDKNYVKFLEKYKEGEYHDDVSILISEWANRGDLLDFLRKYYKKLTLTHWKVIFFQIISTLTVIQSKFPSFRHNDMKANNILIHKTDNKRSYYNYTAANHKYTVPNILYQIKIWDFDFACIPDIIDNSKVSAEWCKSINVTPTQNRYYDMHYFFNTLIKKGFLPQIMTDDKVPKEVKEFINRVVPEKYQQGKYIHKRGRILINDEYLLPKDVLSGDPFFEEFRKKH
jgi:serine/threonine protein kinase